MIKECDDHAAGVLPECSNDNFKEVRAKLEEFEAARSEERRRMYEAVISLGLRIAAFGVILIGIRAVLLKVHNLADWLAPISHFFMVSGIMLISTCPIESVDFDKSMESNMKMRVTIFLLQMGFSFAAKLLPSPMVPISVIPPLLGLTSTCFLRQWRSLPKNCRLWDSTLTTSWFIVLLFQEAMLQIVVQCQSNSPVLLLAAFALLVPSIALTMMWQQLRRGGISNTSCLYAVMYGFYVCWGLDWILLGALYHMEGRESLPKLPRHNLVMIFCGIAFLTPCLVLLIVGRERFFNIMAHRLDHNQQLRELDGAFLASLLTSIQVVVGQIWYVHRSDADKDHAFTPEDYRHHWRKGTIREIDFTHGTFTVGCPREHAPRHDTNPMFHVTSSMFTIVRAASSMVKASSQVYAISGEINFDFPLGGHTTPAEELLRFARDNMRCIDWNRDIMHELITGVKNGSFDVNNLFDLSRPLNCGERVDYFMSHSWYANSARKMDTLTVIAERFWEVHGRYPTFWLDKVCIDQNKIADGLRALGVNVMACNQMLVLCDATYPTRLWCTWELFTLFGFCGTEAARKRVRLVPVDDDDSSSHEALKMLLEFDARHAHCYDPNEEAKLRAVIDVRGVDCFNLKVRQLAQACSEALKASASNSMIPGSSKFFSFENRLTPQMSIDTE